MILVTVLIATLVIAISLPVLGQRVLERRIVFVDLALAQVAATGYALGMALHMPGILIAIITTTIAVALMALMDEDTILPKEAVMGAIYAFAASLGMVLLSLLPYGEGQLMGLMFGSILAINWEGIGILIAFSAIGLALALSPHSNTYHGRLRFSAGLSLIIVPAIHAIGVLLVFAYLVMPALAVWRHGHNGPIWQATALAALASLIGTLSAHFLDLPPSATVVLTLGLISCMIGILIHVKHQPESTKNNEENDAEDDDVTPEAQPETPSKGNTL